MLTAVEQAGKRPLAVHTNRLPALPSVIKLPSLGKIRLVKFNIRDHQKMCVQMVPHIVQMRFV